MPETVIQVEQLSKYYRLGLIGRSTLREDLNAWWARLRGKTSLHPELSGHLSGRAQGEIWALNEINFAVERGEILGIIGRNGAGKSTLLKILSRITAPTTGRIKMKGRVGSLLEVGTGFHEELTGTENIFLNGAILGMDREEVASKLDEIISFAEMAQFVDTPVKRYSSGMRVRLAFSVAAHLETEILIVDEVLAVGDIEFQKKCIGKMESVAGAGRTVLFVSHNMNIVQNLCTRGIVIDQGKIAFDGSINDATRIHMSNGGKVVDVSTEKFRGVMQQKIGFNSVKINHQAISDIVQVSPSQAIVIELDGISKALIKDAEVFVAVFSDGYRLATIFDEEVTTSMQEGAFSSTFVMPQNLLKPGEYSIKIGAQSPRLKEWMISDFLGSFNVSPHWSETIQERKVGTINIINEGGGRTQKTSLKT